MIALGLMDNDKIGELIHQLATEVVEDYPGLWKFEFDQKLVYVITAPAYNRMRIISPVASAKSLEIEQWKLLMEANYDRAVDARYCLHDETLWSAFLHPLAELDADQFMSGLEQVVNLVNNYGTSFSSSSVTFAG